MKNFISTQLLISLVLILPYISFAQKSDSVENNISKSKFATLYIYHPNEGPYGAFKIHLGDSVIWNTKYNTKRVIRLYKEGKTVLWAGPKMEISITLDVKFGEKYFVKCILLTEEKIFKPTIKLEDSYEGKMEYGRIRKNPDSLKLIKTLDTILRRNTIYLEFAGQALLYSLNYDRLLRTNKRIKNSVTFGLELIPETWDLRNLILVAPVSYNVILGRKNHHFELGIGLTPVYWKTLYTEQIPFQFVVTTSRKDYFLYASPKIGYRYQPLRGGFFFRVTITPITNIIQYFGAIKYKNANQYNRPASYRYFEPFYDLGPVLPWAGISIGYSFNFKKPNRNISRTR